MLSVVGQRSAGALDNASGVAAVLDAAAALSPALPIGVLIADAEELSLAGARAWARSRPAGVALNCDSVDDDGSLVGYGWLLPRDAHRRLNGWGVVHPPHRETLRIRRLLRESSPTASARSPTPAGDLDTEPRHARTLLRIHTSRDNLPVDAA
jgi:hypothetical protein